jgi:hypothetical protein
VPKKILIAQRTKFWSLLKAGYSIKEASRRANFSESYGKSLVRNGANGPNGAGPGNASDKIRETEEEEEERLRPKRRHELPGVALRCLDDFEEFRWRYLGSVSTPWQIEAAQRAVELLDTPDKSYLVINCPQGGGKTRLFSHDLTAWLTVRNRAIRGIFGSLSQSVSGDLCGNLRDTLERTSPALARPEDRERGLARDADATLAGDYGRFRPVGAGGRWRRDNIIVEQLDGASVEKEPTWAAFSREAKFLGWRVDFMVWDDLVDFDLLRNPDRVQDLYNWWDINAESRLDPGGLLLLVGQRLRSNDIYRYCLDKRIQIDEFDDDSESRPMYHHIIYKAHYDDRCDGRNASHGINAPPYPDGCMLDPPRIKWRDIREKQAAGNYEVVYQQQDTDPTNVLVQKDWVAGCWDDDRFVGELPPIPSGSDVVRYITVDPSPTKYWAVIDWLYVLDQGVDPTAGYRYVIDVCRRKMGANDFLDWERDGTYIGVGEEWVQRAKTQGHPVDRMIVERNGAQRFMLQVESWRNWCRSRGVEISEHDTTNNKSDPEYGVWATIPNAWRFNRVRLPGADVTSRNTVYPLVQEVTTYPDGATDDCVMSQWFGEYHLPNLIGTRKTVGPMNRHRPSWVHGGTPHVSHAQQRVAELAYR